MWKKLLLCLLLVFLLSPLAPQGAEKKKDYAIEINNQWVSPTDSMLTLISIAGFPDHIRAMRGKESKDDYVMFEYYSYSLKIDISSDYNQIKNIIVEENKLKLKNVPFKIGSDFTAVTSSWGKPDLQDSGWACYWNRGVYFGVADNGVVGAICLTTPAPTETSDQKTEK